MTLRSCTAAAQPKNGRTSGGPTLTLPNERVQLLDKQGNFLETTYCKVASTNASRFVTNLVYKRTQIDNFL